MLQLINYRLQTARYYVCFSDVSTVDTDSGPVILTIISASQTPCIQSNKLISYLFCQAVSYYKWGEKPIAGRKDIITIHRTWLALGQRAAAARVRTSIIVTVYGPMGGANLPPDVVNINNSATSFPPAAPRHRRPTRAPAQIVRQSRRRRRPERILSPVLRRLSKNSEKNRCQSTRARRIDPGFRITLKRAGLRHDYLAA